MLAGERSNSGALVSALIVRKRYSCFLAVFSHALDSGVDEDVAIVAGVRRAFSQKVRRSDEWRLRKGRAILCGLGRVANLTSPPTPSSLHSSRGPRDGAPPV